MAAAPPTPAQVRTILESNAEGLKASAKVDGMSAEATAVMHILEGFGDSIGAVYQAPVIDLATVRLVAEAGLAGLGVRLKPELNGSAIPAKDVEAATGIKAWWFDWPGSSRDAVIFHVHGGGRVLGSASPDAGYTEGFACEQISRIANARVLSIDYTLAPEANGRQQVDECITVYKYVLERLGVPAGKTAWMGASGGGSLVLSVVLRIASTKLPRCAAAWVSSPVAMEVSEDADARLRKSDVFVGPVSLRGWVWMADLLSNKGLPTEIPRQHADVLPYYGDYHNVCPMYITASQSEVLYDGTVAVAKKARAAGVSVRTYFPRKLFHAFHIMPDFVPESREELGVAGAYLREHIWSEF